MSDGVVDGRSYDAAGLEKKKENGAGLSPKHAPPVQRNESGIGKKNIVGAVA